MVVRELLIKLGLTGGSATANQLDKIDGKVRQVSEGFSALGGVLTGVLAGLSISSISHIADDMQSLEFRLGQMVTSANGGAEAIDNLSQHAQKARVSIESYAEAYTGIGAATHELIHSEQELLNVTDSVAMGLQLAGANTQQTTSVMQQLTQAIAVGKLQWADMRIIMQNSDAFAGRLAKSLGMTLNQMVQATQGKGGGIGADKIVYALRDMSEQVRKEFAQMPLTVKQATTVIGARWDMFIHRLNRSSGAVTWVADKFLWLADQVEYGLDVVVKALGGAENAVKLLGVALASAGIVGGIWAITAAFSALTSPIFLTMAALAALFLVGEDVYGWLKGQDSLLGRAIGPVTEYKDAINELKVAFDDLRAIVVGTLRALREIADFFNSSQDYAQDLGDKLGTTKFAPWLKEKAGWLTEDLGQWGKWANNKTYGVFDVGSAWSGAMQWLKSGNEESGNDGEAPTVDSDKILTNKLKFDIPSFHIPPIENGGFPSVIDEVDGSSGAVPYGNGYPGLANDLKGMFTAPAVTPAEMVPVSNINNRSDVSQQFTYQPNNTYNIYPATNSGEDIRSSTSSYDRDSYRNFRESIANDLQFNAGPK